MKRTRYFPALLALAFALAAGLVGCEGAGGRPRIGVALFSVDDSFVSDARRALEAEASGKAYVSVLDGQNQQPIQNSQIDAMIADKAKAIIVYPVDPASDISLIFRAKAGGVPVVFFSQDPSTMALNFWDKAFFVGVDTQEAERLQVEILGDYWKGHGDTDKDHDDRIQYVLLHGVMKRQDALASAENRQKAFEAAGIKAAKLAELSADGTRVDAHQKMDDLIKQLGSRQIEAVLCSNDEMALGAIESLKVAGYFKGSGGFVPVIGVDGTRFALDAIADGSLLGTVRGDPKGLGRAAFDLAYALATGADPLAAGWNLTEGKYVLVPYQKVTRDNYRSFAQ